MNRNEHQKDGGRKRYRLFVFVMVTVMVFMVCLPWWYKGGADKEAVAEEAGGEEQVYDTVIAGGRVMNPETKLDKLGWNVGISGGQVAVVTPRPLKGKHVIDATGLIVAPGFVDNLSYNPNPLGVWNKIADGVTTNIAMHGGTSAPEEWYNYYAQSRIPVNFGASFFYTESRNRYRLGRYDSALPGQIGQLVRQAEQALNEGALGISLSLEYVPGITAAEILPLMELAYDYNVPVYFHARYSDMEEPGTNLDAVSEIIRYARKTGAAVHIDHINSTGGTFSMKKSLAMISAARKKGMDITSCVYPYDYWGTFLNSARFDEGWQSRFRITFHDLQVAGTGERLTEETFGRFREEGKLAVAYAIPEQDVVDALKAPYVMIGSDAILEPGNNNHPRASGTFARTIGLYVREKKTLTLMEALAKMTLLPAQRLEKQAPSLRKKGRLAKGMDADLVIFDFKTITDRSTVEHPEQMSGGIRYVLVGGQLALENGKLSKHIPAGKPIRSEFVRVKSGTGQLSWGNRQYAVADYKGQPYVDVRSLEQHGYKLTWNKAALKVTAKRTRSKVSGISGAELAPEEGLLMLERGYRLEAGGLATDLLSIGSRMFMPLSMLGKLGHEVTAAGIALWTASEAAGVRFR
ncbi:amidohydrolase family protein [Paenibacillus glycanilyticus]|uniref:amidohydrolase family protein n=1 Tax=Paenibacillus glycanilyticus TaxID=126569 RepID=UPI00203DD3D9|nr:amidohydrolase family protein [Paenibacillus glycanilyticus]MCM3627648.1 amidohydrolase family protein [Paenibacillus glycanilyticus]